MGYQTVKPMHWFKSWWDGGLNKRELIWDPDERILRTESYDMFSPLTELCFENSLDPSSSIFTVFLCHRNSNAVVMKDMTFSEHDRLLLLSILRHNASQSDYGYVTIQNHVGYVYRVSVVVRKMIVRGRIVFELSLEAILVSFFSSSDVTS